MTQKSRVGIIHLDKNKKFILLILMIIVLASITSHSQAQATLLITTNNPGINNDGLCSLEEAVTNANNNTATYSDCPAGTGTGTDTIDLNGRTVAFVTAPVAYDALGYNALPEIVDALILTNGTIQRDTSLLCEDGPVLRSEFRLLYNTSDLTLDNITIENGCITNSRGGEIGRAHV